jgi:hypothetical protein
MKHLLLILTVWLTALSGKAQHTDLYLGSPLNLRVMVRFAHDKDDPVRAAYLYRQLRDIPNITLVQEEPEYFLDVNTSNTKSGIFTMEFVVLRPATPVFRDVLADRVETRLKMQDDANWQEAGNLIREEAVRIPGAFFYKGIVGSTGMNANAVTDTAVKNFEVNYVEPARLKDRETKDHIQALQERAAVAKTPEEKRAAAAAIAEYIGLPIPVPTKP